MANHKTWRGVVSLIIKMSYPIQNGWSRIRNNGNHLIFYIFGQVFGQVNHAMGIQRVFTCVHVIVAIWQTI